MSDKEMNCEEALRLLAFFLDGELDPGETDRVQEHLHRCKSCFSRGEFESKLKMQLAGLRSADVTSELEQRVRDIMHNFGTA